MKLPEELKFDRVPNKESEIEMDLFILAQTVNHLIKYLDQDNQKDDCGFGCDKNTVAILCKTHNPLFPSPCSNCIDGKAHHHKKA